MISLILVFIASFCNAAMDNISHHGYKSIFNKYAPEMWNPNESWKQKELTKLPDWWSDWWHRFKTIMLFSLIFAVVLYKPMINWYWDFGILGVAHILTFNLFYNKLLNE